MDGEDVNTLKGYFPTEEVASQQQTLSVAEDPLQDMTVTCKQCEVTFVFTKGEQWFFKGRKRDARNAGNDS